MNKIEEEKKQLGKKEAKKPEKEEGEEAFTGDGSPMTSKTNGIKLGVLSTQSSRGSPSPKKLRKVAGRAVKHHQIAIFPTFVQLIQAITGRKITFTGSSSQLRAEPI